MLETVKNDDLFVDFRFSLLMKQTLEIEKKNLRYFSFEIRKRLWKWFWLI